MGEIFAVLLSFPAVVFTVLTALAMLYWIFVIVGAVDMDSLGGAKEGVLEGAVKGAFEGAAGVAKGGADAAVDGLTGAAKGVAGGGDLHADVDGGAGFMSTMQLRNAPVTVVASLFAIFGLLITGLYGLTFGVPSFLLGLPLFLGTSVVSLLLTSVAIRPLAPVFKVHKAKKHSDFVGKIATINTGKVTERFGQATLEDGGAGLIIEVREARDNQLKRGDRVVLVHWDEAKEAFEVEPMPDSLGRPRGASSAEEAEAAAEVEAMLEERGKAPGARERG